MRTFRLVAPSATRAAALATSLLLAGGCASPDPEAELDEFREAALTDTGGGDTDISCSTERPTPDGDYLCALSATLDRQKPLYILVNFTLDGDTLSVTGQPLVRDLDEDGATPMANARQPAGDPLADVTTTLESDGSFTIDWSGSLISGEANPLTYRELGGDLILTGTFITDDVAAGDMGGQVTNPTVVPLAGSTFACERTDDATTVDPVYYNGDIVEITPCASEGSGDGA